MVLKNADSDFSPRISPRNWLLPVLNNQNTPPVAPNDGDRYRVTAVATGAWTGQENTIAVWEADARTWRFAALVEPQIWYDMTSQNWHYMSHAGVITQFDKIPLAISDVTGLQAALDGKAPLVHKANHVSGGSDAFVGGDLLDATARLNFLLGGAAVSARRGLNVIAGTNISLSFVDNPGSERTDLTINSAAGGAHALLDGVVDSDTVAQAPARGMMIIGNSTLKWSGLALGGAGQIPISNGTDLLYRVLAKTDIPNLDESQITNLVADLAAKEISANKNVANGYCPLDASALVPRTNLANMPYAELGTQVLGGAAASLSIIVAAKKNLMVIIRVTGLSGANDVSLQFNGDAGANYNVYGTLVGTNLNQTQMYLTLSANSGERLIILFIRNEAATTKDITGHGQIQTANTAGTFGGFWNNTLAQITTILLKATAGNLNAGTMMTVLGFDE